MARPKHPNPAFEPPDSYIRPPQSEWVGPHQIRVRWRKKGMPSVSKVVETWEQAWSWFDVKRAEYELRGTIADRREIERTTIRELLELYLSSGLIHQKQGALEETNRVKQLQRQPFAELMLSAFRPMDLQTWINDRMGQGLSPSTVRNDLSALSNAFEYGKTLEGFEGLINPTRAIRKPKQKPGRKVKFTEEDEARLIAAIDGRKRVLTSWWLGSLVRLALLTGMRLSELMRVKIDDVHIDDSFLSVESKDTDGTRIRDVPLIPSAVECLRDAISIAREKGQETLFPMGLTNKTVSKLFASAAALAGVDVGFHDLRHVAVTRLSKIATSPLELAEFSGHRSLTALKIYYNPSAKDLAAMAANVIERQKKSQSAMVLELDDDDLIASIRTAARRDGKGVDTMIIDALRLMFLEPAS
jgi:integrase